MDRYLPVGHAARDYDQSGHTYIMSGFFEELQRRKVYRVAAAYIVAAGFLIQIASAAFPAWELPNWSLRLVIVLLLIGFPIALILAWAYDITPQGIQGTPKTPGVHRRRNLILLIVPRCHHLCFRWIFSIATSRPGQNRQIRRGPAFSKLKQRSG